MGPVMAQIRAAVADEAAALAALAEHTFRDTFAATNSAADMALHCARSYSPSIQRAEITDPAMATLVGVDAGELQAYAQLRLRHATPCVALAKPAELQRIYVARQWQGRGLAQELLSAVLALARGHGADGLWLGVWERNPRAIAFYAKHGFEACGEHVFQLGSDPQRDVVMALRFGPAVR